MELTNVVTLIVSILALGLGVWNYHRSQKQDRRDLFLQMHERLIDPDIQRGRRLLYDRAHTAADAAHLRHNEQEAYQLINRALGMFDIFAMYVRRGYIDRDLALEEWGHAFARTYQKAQPLIRDRLENQTWETWKHLREFGREAEIWHETHKRPLGGTTRD